MQDPTHPAQIRRPDFSLWRGFTVALWLLVAQIIVAIPAVLIAFLISGKEDVNSAMSSSIGIVLLVSFPLAVWLVLRNWRLDLSDFEWDRKLLVPGLLAILLTLAVSFLFGELLTYLPNYEDMVGRYSEMFGQIKPIYLMLGGVIIGPICEELIFRGVILKEFLNAHPPSRAIVFSAIVFGVIHGIAIQVLYAFILGLVLGWVYYRTRSLWICILLHVVNNALAFGGGEASSESLSGDMNFSMYLGLIGLALVVAGASVYGFDRKAPTHDPSAFDDLVSFGNSDQEE